MQTSAIGASTLAMTSLFVCEQENMELKMSKISLESIINNRGREYKSPTLKNSKKIYPQGEEALLKCVLCVVISSQRIQHGKGEKGYICSGETWQLLQLGDQG